MYLTRIQLDLGHWGVTNDLLDRDRIHKRVCSWFPEIPGGPCGNARERHGIIFRVEEAFMIMLSRQAPHILPRTGYSLVVTRDVTENYAAIKEGHAYRFRIDANTSLRVPKTNDEWIPETDASVATKAMVQYRRVGCGVQEARSRWFENAARRNGFVIDMVDSQPMSRIKVGRGSLEVTRFEGRLVVKIRSVFMKALTGGIGQGKAYGLGCLSLKNP